MGKPLFCRETLFSPAKVQKKIKHDRFCLTFFIFVANFKLGLSDRLPPRMPKQALTQIGQVLTCERFSKQTVLMFLLS